MMAQQQQQPLYPEETVSQISVLMESNLLKSDDVTQIDTTGDAPLESL